MKVPSEEKNKRRLLNWRTLLIVAILLYTFVGFVVVPWIAKGIVLPKVSEALGQEISVQKVRCNPFTLSLTIEGLSLPDRSGAPMLSFDSMYANLQASSLFKLALVLKEIRIENPYAAVRRLPDREINVLEVANALKSEEPTTEEKGLPRAILQEIRMTGGRFDLEDQAREEPLLWQAGPAQLELNDISTLPGDEGDNDFVIGLPGGGTMQINGNVVVEPLGLDGRLEFDKIVLANAWPAIADRFEFDLVGGSTSAKLQYSIRFDDGELQLEVEGADINLSDLNFHTKADEELATIRSVAIASVDAAWPEQRIRAESLTVDGANVQVWLETDGTPSWADLVPKKTQERIVETYEKVKDQIDIDAKLGRFQARNSSASFENRMFAEPHRVEVSDAELALTDVSTEPESQWGLVASASLGGESKASAKGTFMALPVTLDVQVELESLELSPFQAYVEQAAPLQLLAGVLSTEGTVRLAPKDETGKVKFQGGLALQGLDLDETVTGGTLIGWGDLKVDGIEAALAPMSLKVAQADVYSAGLEVAVAEDGTVNLLQFIQALGDGGEETVENGGATGEKKDLPPAEIAAVELHDCYGVYRDATTPTPFERQLESIDGTVSNISTTSGRPADLAIQAALDSGGAVTIEGQMDLLQYMRLTDLAVDISMVQLPPMSPMSVKIIGFPIENGQTTMDLDYQITDYQLQSTNHVEVLGLSLGEKVEGEGKIKAPVKMGVSLLKDKNGQITLDVPMDGDLRNPDFVVGSAVSAAIAGVVGDLVQSPFRMLGRLVGGGDDQDLGFVDFEAGSAMLEPIAEINLTTLAKALEERPELVLEISGAYDAKSDLEGLRENALLRELGVDPTTGDRDDIALREMESTFEGQTSPSEAAMIRGQYMADDGSVDEAGLRDALWNQMLATQVVSETDARALAPARAEAIRAFLVEQQGVDGGRVTVLPDARTLDAGEPMVRCELGLSTE